LVFLTVGSPAVYAIHEPVAPDGVVEFRFRSAVLMNLERFDPLLELQGWLEDEEHELRYRALTLGSYYRPHDNVKVGLFYRLQQGARHDDDWVAVGSDWEWKDTRHRTEHVLIADVSPRFGLEFLPGGNWVFMLKSRYLFNTFNGQHTVLLRPGMTYFLLIDREPLLNVSLNYNIYFPLNFGNTTVYKHWPYLNVLFHLTQVVKLEATAAYKTVVWSTSQEVKDSDEPGYEVDYRAFVLGLGLLFQFDL
jgi:hypothetical protein